MTRMLLFLYFLLPCLEAMAFDRNQTLFLQIPYPPKSLHPLNVEGYDAGFAHSYVIESLLRRDKNTNEFTPSLATRFEIDRDKNTFTFWLRKGVVWSDGEPFDAEDVKFSFDALFSGKFRTYHLSSGYEGIGKVEILSPHKVRFHAKSSYFRNFYSAAEMIVVPKHVYGVKDPGFDLNKSFIGTGPYKLKFMDQGKYIHLTKNPHWWGAQVKQTQGIHKAKDIVFRFIGETFMALEMLKSGSLDYVKLDLRTYSKISKETKDAPFYLRKVQNSTPKSVPYLGFNLEHPILQQKHVRLALSLCFDRKAIEEKLFSNQYQAAKGPWYSESPFAPKNPEFKGIFSIKKAYSLLKSNGWKDEDGDGVLEKNGRELKFTIIFGGDAPDEVLNIFQHDASLAGIKIRLKQHDWSVINEKLKRKSFDALYVDWGGGSIELDPKPAWHSSSSYEKGGLNFMNYKNPEVDSLIEKMIHTPEFDSRKKMAQKIYRLINQDLPALFFFYPRYKYYALSNRIGQTAPTLKYDIGKEYWWIK